MDSQLPIRNLDYAVIFARQMPEMCDFYEKTLGFEFHRRLGPKWVEFRVGSSLVAIAEPGGLFNDPVPPVGVMSVQLAFRVAPAEVELCAATLLARGVQLISGPTDRPFGHRTLFFRDPDGNVIEIYAEI